MEKSLQKLSANQKQVLPMEFFVQSKRNEESLLMMSRTLCVPSYKSFGLVVSEMILTNSVNQKICSWWSCFLPWAILVEAVTNIIHTIFGCNWPSGFREDQMVDVYNDDDNGKKSEWLLFNANSAIFQLLVYHGENKIIFNEMMMRSALF